MGEKVKIKIKLALVGLLLVVGQCFLVTSAQAGSQYFSPSGGSYSSTGTFSVNVYASSADQAASAFSGYISFPADKLSVTSVSKSGSIITLWVKEPTYSNTAGTVSFEGVIPNPGYTGSGGRLVTITFRAKGSGSAALAFTDGSVLANDGLGTDITTGLGSANFTLFTATPAEIIPTPIKEPEAAPIEAEVDEPVIETVVPVESPQVEQEGPSFVWGANAINTLALVELAIWAVMLLLVLLALVLTLFAAARLLQTHAHRVRPANALLARRVRRTLRKLRRDIHKNLRRLEDARRVRNLSAKDETIIRSTSNELIKLEEKINRTLSGD